MNNHSKPMQPNIFDHYPADKQVVPPFPFDTFKYDDLHRPLTGKEVMYCKYQMSIVAPLFLEQKIDIVKAQTTVLYLYKMYPFLISKIVWDDDLKWYRFAP